MLETKDLCKQYTPKKGVPVQAVDHVSLRFPEKGMVFLLGKSGSGKSTMLNLLGGLDQYDSGEIIIKGVSSKDFSQQHFDSYRNTYVGFIFQEYNVLEEFTVGANIALALELQGRSASDEELNAILAAVDLAGYGDRKPNELSGGQKQRVAIARALVKNPQIIMADEPTGALDSNTGRQVLDTLKKLSSEKLVIVVSHDREYAEQYADRIIELADGKVIRDVESVHDENTADEKHLVFRTTSVEIPADYHLTEEDRIQINEYLDRIRSGAALILPSTSQRFSDTDESRIPKQDGSGFNLIKSRLPMKKAFRIGCSSLKHKRFRLVTTILLSAAAFTMFSLVDTFSSYSHVQSCTDSLIDSGVSFLSMNKAVRRGSGIDEWWDRADQRISEAELEEIRKDTGVDVNGLFIPYNGNLHFDGLCDSDRLAGETKEAEDDFYNGTPYLKHFCGFAEITEESAKAMHFELLAGTYPDGSKNEIAVSAAVCDTFIRGGYLKPEADGAVSGTYETISSPAALIGKTIPLMGTEYTVCGVLDTGLDMSRYESVFKERERLTNEKQALYFILQQEYMIATNYTYTGCAMVGAGKVQELVGKDPKTYIVANRKNADLSAETDRLWFGSWISDLTTPDHLGKDDIIWLDGERKTLAENEVILSLENMNLGEMDGCTEAERALLKKMEAMQTGLEPVTAESLREVLKPIEGKLRLFVSEIRNDYSEESNVYDNLKIVGVIPSESPYSGCCVLAEKFFSELVEDTDGVYDSAVGVMPASRGDIEKLVSFCYDIEDGQNIRYMLNDPVIYELDMVNTALRTLAKVFLYIGIGFAVFALLLMANFISTSIHYKRQEIGILRAIGSRSNDVFRIFFSESFVIAMINFVLSSGLCFAAVTLINHVLRTRAGILITVLHFGVRQLLLLLAICIGGAAIASFLPVRRIAAKKPIDAIRDK